MSWPSETTFSGIYAPVYYLDTQERLKQRKWAIGTEKKIPIIWESLRRNRSNRIGRFVGGRKKSLFWHSHRKSVFYYGIGTCHYTSPTYLGSKTTSCSRDNEQGNILCKPALLRCFCFFRSELKEWVQVDRQEKQTSRKVRPTVSRQIDGCTPVDACPFLSLYRYRFVTRIRVYSLRAAGWLFYVTSTSLN